jgi:hypothetical protein
MANIKSVFDVACKDIKLDNSFLKSIHAYGQSFVNRNEDHVHFFGSNLTGVYPVRFKSADRIEWIDDVLSIDEYAIRQAIVELPSVDENWKRATDVMNLSCLYLVHRVFNSSLNPKQKEQGMTDLLLVLQYKFISSLMAHYFPYPADEKTALATYAALSRKYSLKQEGTWHGVLLKRAKDIMSKQSVHYQTIARFDDDAAIVYMVTDIQGRLRNMLKKLWSVFEMVRSQEAKIHTTAGMVELDGKMVVRDISRNYPPYRRYLNEVIHDKNRFVKQELVDVIASAMHTMPEKLLIDSLNYLCDNSNNKDVEVLLDETLTHAFEYLSTDSRAQSKFNDIPMLISKLRALYMASRSSDPSLLKMREIGEKIVKKAVKTTNTSVIAAVRTGVMLYIVLRTFSKNHYG